MNTGPIESWSQNPADTGAMYPFVGWEVSLFVVCVAAWLIWTVWQIASEHREYAEQAKKLQQSGELEKVMSHSPTDVLLPEDQ